MDAPLGGAGSTPPPHSGTPSDNPQSAYSLSTAEDLPGKDQGSGPDIGEDENTEACDATANDKNTNQKYPASQPKASSATCIPKTTERIKIDLPSQRINSEIQFMKDHALIGKFLGFWSTEKALHGWIASKWKPKGQVTLQLGPKGFFTATFNCLEDKTRVFEGGPYFFNSLGLYLREWKERFNPDKEDFSWALVWICLYSLPLEYWNEETLMDIGNSLGAFIKVAEETKNQRYTSYARICVQMHLTKALANSVSLFHDDYEWIQTIDYEHIPFRCRKCHEHGHLFRDCPLNLQSKTPTADPSTDSEGFTKVPTQRRHAKKNLAGLESSNTPETKNRFILLSSQENTEDNHAAPKILPPFVSSLNPKASLPSSSKDPSRSPNPTISGPTSPKIAQQSSAMELDVALALVCKITLQKKIRTL